MKETLRLVLLLFFAFSCSKSDIGQTEVDPPVIQVDNGSSDDSDSDNSQQSTSNYQIVLDDISNVDLTEATVYGPYGTAEIDESGAFSIAYDSEGLEELPLLVNKGDEILFGYFPNRISNGQITSTDILNFFALIYPEIAVNGYDSNEVINFLERSSKKDMLVDLLNTALDQNMSPIENEEFLSLLSTELQFFIEDSLTNKFTSSTNKYLEEFAIEYERDGIIKLPLEAPVFASMGIEVRDSISNQYVVNDHILKPKSLVLNTSSLGEFIGDWLLENVFNLPVIKYQEVILQDNGIYRIRMNNGRSSGQLSDKVSKANEWYFTSKTIAYAVPKGIKRILNSNNCQQALIQIQSEIATKFGLWLFNKPDAAEVYGLVRNTSINFSDAVLECIAETSYRQYLKVLLKYAIKLTDSVKDASEFTFFIRDFFLSEIDVSETRYFNNGISYGELRYSDLTDIDIVGESGSEFIYEGLVEEKKVYYGVDRPLSGSTFTKEEDYIKASEIPFSASLTHGDASLNGQNPIISDDTGNIRLSGQIGNENSIIEISSLLDYSQIDLILLRINQSNGAPEITDSVWSAQFSEDCSFDTSLSSVWNEIIFLNDSTFTIPSRPVWTPLFLRVYSLQGDTLYLNAFYEEGGNSDCDRDLANGFEAYTYTYHNLTATLEYNHHDQTFTGNYTWDEILIYCDNGQVSNYNASCDGVLTLNSNTSN